MCQAFSNIFKYSKYTLYRMLKFGLKHHGTVFVLFQLQYNCMDVANMLGV